MCPGVSTSVSDNMLRLQCGQDVDLVRLDAVCSGCLFRSLKYRLDVVSNQILDYKTAKDARNMLTCHEKEDEDASGELIKLEDMRGN